MTFHKVHSGSDVHKGILKERSFPFRCACLCVYLLPVDQISLGFFLFAFLTWHTLLHAIVFGTRNILMSSTAVSCRKFLLNNRDWRKNSWRSEWRQTSEASGDVEIMGQKKKMRAEKIKCSTMVSATWQVWCGNKSEMFLGTRDKRKTSRKCYITSARQNYSTPLCI